MGPALKRSMRVPCSAHLTILSRCAKGLGGVLQHPRRTEARGEPSKPAAIPRAKRRSWNWPRALALSDRAPRVGGRSPRHWISQISRSVRNRPGTSEVGEVLITALLPRALDHHVARRNAERFSTFARVDSTAFSGIGRSVPGAAGTLLPMGAFLPGDSPRAFLPDAFWGSPAPLSPRIGACLPRETARPRGKRALHLFEGPGPSRRGEGPGRFSSRPAGLDGAARLDAPIRPDGAPAAPPVGPPSPLEGAPALA
jgi:hypothetical protein